LTRRSVQSQAVNLVFSTRRTPVAFRRKSQFPFHRPRDTQRMMCAMSKAGVFSILFVVMLFAVAIVAEAQQPARIPRIGILAPLSASFFSARDEAFRQRLRELGYVEGKNIVIEIRYADGKLERMSDLAAELVQLKVDVIVTAGPGILAAKKASTTIPIVFGAAGDPVGAGIVSSLARPGGNITGLSNIAQDLDGKRLELLKEAFPKVARVALLWDPGTPRANLSLREMEAAAKALGLKLQSLPVRGIDDFEGAHRRGTEFAEFGLFLIRTHCSAPSAVSSLLDRDSQNSHWEICPSCENFHGL
jgi:ABC-type uncharacterized transport system substrate-binding protein